jgi:hypothetical protein
MYRGRAAVNLTSKAQPQPWETLVKCPYEDLRDPGRLHVDPFGYLHICQGIAIGNLFEESLDQIVARYDPETHPVCGALLAGGPAEVRRYDLAHHIEYADTCFFHEPRCLAPFPASDAQSDVDNDTFEVITN